MVDDGWWLMDDYRWWMMIDGWFMVAVWWKSVGGRLLVDD